MCEDEDQDDGAEEGCHGGVPPVVAGDAVVEGGVPAITLLRITSGFKG